MKYIFNHIEYLKRKINSNKFIFLLDFDLTLSPLAKNPNHAFLPIQTKENLKKIISKIPVVIISGRKLSDVKKRINIKGVYYVGNHGFEHNLNGKYEVIKLPSPIKKALLKAKEELVNKCKSYKGIVFEDKKYVFALGYRLVKKDQVKSLETIFRGIQKEVEKDGLLRTRLDKKTFELLPIIEADKGTACLLALKIIQKRLHSKFTPIYIGDGQTDEDAFRILRKSGITIRVGKSSSSSAKWYLRNQKEVNKFFIWLLSFS